MVSCRVSIPPGPENLDIELEAILCMEVVVERHSGRFMISYHTTTYDIISYPQPSTTGPQHHRATGGGGGRGTPTIHHAWGGGCDAVPYIYIYLNLHSIYFI